MNEAIEAIRADENLREALEETYAGGGKTYAELLDGAATIRATWELLIDAASIARASGDFIAADTIREGTSRFMKLAGLRA